MAKDGKTAAETALERISINPNEYGINSHYLILTDGSLQRARPIDKVRSSVAHPRFSKTGLQLSFISGGKIPNSKMFETYDRFLKAWSISLPVALVATTIVAPIVEKFVDKITK